MTPSDLEDLRQASLIYMNTVSKTNNDLNFYRSFLKHSIDRYLSQEYQPEQIYSAVFHAYNISPETGDGWGRMHKDIDHVLTIDLHASSEAFMCSIANQSLLRIYNAMEVFFFEAIKIRYFPNLKNPTGSRKASSAVTTAIIEDLKSIDKRIDSRNNMHILSFLRKKSAELDWFLNQKMRIDLDTDWNNFFELTSILRNLVGHHGTIVSSDTKNEIHSKAKDVFARHFDLIKDQNGYLNLLPKIDQFSNFISFYNDFTMNIVKFIFGYEDLEIFDMF